MQNFKSERATLRKIMRRKEFIAGFNDAKSGMGYRPEYETMGHKQLTYERGRQLFAFNPTLIRIKDSRTIRDDALKAFSIALVSKAII